MSTQSLERSPAEVVPMDDDQLLPLGDSILASWIRSICQTVRGYGVSPEAIFERIGMDPTLLTVPDARYPAMTVRRFWEAVISATGDELIGLTCGQEMQAPTLHGLGLVIMTSHSLAQVLELTASYGKVISTTMDMSLAHNASSSSLSLRTLHGNEAKQAALLCVIAFIQRQANSLSQHRVTPVEVGVQINNCSRMTENGWKTILVVRSTLKVRKAGLFATAITMSWSLMQHRMPCFVRPTNKSCVSI